MRSQTPLRIIALEVDMILALILAVTTLFSADPPSTRVPLNKARLDTPGLTCLAYDKSGTAIVRSMTRRALFLRMVKRSSADPECAYVNHIVPLRCGGCDIPSNMECMSEAEWKGRTGPERYDCGRHAGGEW